MASPRIIALFVLYVLLFAALGAEVSFLPLFLSTTGLSAAHIGLLLTAGTVTQVCSAPIFGIAADRFGPRLVLGISACVAAASFLFFLVSSGSVLFALFVNVLFAMGIAPLNPLADAISVPACLRVGMPYGRLRGIGSAGFFAGVLLSSTVTARHGTSGIVPITAILLALLAALVPALPRAVRMTVHREATADEGLTAGIRALMARQEFRRVLLVAALVLGGHAVSDAFAVIHWTAIGIGAQTIGNLLAAAVGSEFLVFIALGPFLLARFGPAACATIGAAAGVVRWAVFAESTDVWLLLAAQLLHGLTFSLVHLACMQVLAIVAPRRFFATAQTLYGVCSNAIASGAITLAAGAMFATAQAHTFWLASGLCVATLPIALRLGSKAEETSDGSKASGSGLRWR